MVLCTTWQTAQSHFMELPRNAARLLVPLFEGWTLPSISQLPSVQQDRVDVVEPVEPAFHDEQSSHSMASPLPPPSVQLPALYDESRFLRNMLDHAHLQPIPQPTSIPTFLVFLPEVPPCLSPEVFPWRVRQTGRQPRICRREGCSAPVPNRCRVRFCQDHCTSPRCNVHARQTRSQLRRCRFRGCQAMVPAECSSGFCDEHCSSPQCSVLISTRPSCSSPGCNAPPSPGCLVRCCEVHCNHSKCS